MSKLPRPISTSGIPRPLSRHHASTPVNRQRHTPDTEARTTGSSSATTQTRNRSTSQLTQTSSNIQAQFGIQSSQAGTSKSSRSLSTGTKQLQSKTKVTITNPTGQKSTEVKIDDKSLKNKGATNKSKQSTSFAPIPPPSTLRKQVTLHMKGQMSKATVGSKVTAVAKKKSRVPPPENIMTPSGPQKVLQKIITEKRVERSRHGEVVSRNVKAIETDPQTGETVQIEEELQQLNPDFPACEGSLKEIVTIVSEKDITEGFEATRENVVRETIKLNADVGLEYSEIERLIEEEKEDVENIMLCRPPELINQATTLYPLHKRANALKLSPENILMLGNSVINAKASADEALPEPTPELMAQLMETSERSQLSTIPPPKIFNTLFDTGRNDDTFITVSSVTPGVLLDVVVPTTIPEVIHEEMLSAEMEETLVTAHNSSVEPRQDNFDEIRPSKPRTRAKRKRRYQRISDETPPWDNVDMTSVIETVGALPKANVIPTDIDEAERNGRMNKTLMRGIEYVLESDPLQYCSRVQLRGTQSPSWFPGYMVALSDTSNIVDVAKSPSAVLFSAWKSVQPDVFSDDSILYN